jgi:hypothetical protein
MKLVIDIPDDEYKFIKDLQSLVIGGRGNCRTIQRDVINAIKNGTPYEEQPKDKWIPVTERLPEDDEDVLVTYIGDAGYSFIEMVWFNGGKFLSQDGKFEISNVLAWMPLPEPYKRGGEEE